MNRRTAWLLGVVVWLAGVGDAQALITQMAEYGGHTYYLLDRSSWAASEAEGVALGGHLATIDSAAEDSFVHTTFGPTVEGDPNDAISLWIGLNDLGTEGTFEWVSGDPVTYTNWAANQPQSAHEDEDVVGIAVSHYDVLSGKWHDISEPLGDRCYGVVEVTTAKVLQVARFEGHAYYLTVTASWADSEALAVSLGGHLATLDTAAEDSFVHTTFGPTVEGDPNDMISLWIGLNDLRTEGTFEWVSGDPVTYTNWAANQPQSGHEDEDVVGIAVSHYDVPSGKWHDIWEPYGDRCYGVVEIIPEPVALTLLGLGALALLRRRRA